MGDDGSAAQPTRCVGLVTHCNTVGLVISTRRSRERSSELKTIAVQHDSGMAHWAEPNTVADNMKTVAVQHNWITSRSAAGGRSVRRV